MLQNEISAPGYLINRAYEKEVRVVFNPAPMSEDAHAFPLEAIELLVINKIEGFELIKKQRQITSLRYYLLVSPPQIPS